MAANPDDSGADPERQPADDHRGPVPRPARSGWPDPAAPGAVDHVEAALLRLCRVMTAVSVKGSTARYPALSLLQSRTLTLLAAARDGLSLRDVSVCLGEPPAAVSRVGGQLVQAGFAERHVGPGNEIRLSISVPGDHALAAVNRARLQWLNGLLDNLTPSEGAAVRDALTQLRDDTVGRSDLW